MQGCGQRDALVFYFSDHGYDVYDTDIRYVGQGRETDPESHKRGLEIPMMVYITPEYEERHPERAAMLRESAEKAFCTDTIINTLCRATGISL